MVIDSISNIYLYAGLHKSFSTAFAYLKGLSKETESKSFVLEDGIVFGSIIEAETEEFVQKTLLERHEKYIDIHYMLEGTEIFGYQNKKYLTIEKEYCEEEDYELLKGNVSELFFTEGDFCIVFPDDAHAPDCIANNPQKVKRVVIKVKK